MSVTDIDFSDILLDEKSYENIILDKKLYENILFIKFHTKLPWVQIIAYLVG